DLDAVDEDFEVEPDGNHFQLEPPIRVQGHLLRLRDYWRTYIPQGPPDRSGCSLTVRRRGGRSLDENLVRCRFSPLKAAFGALENELRTLADAELRFACEMEIAIIRPPGEDLAPGSSGALSNQRGRIAVHN